MYGDILVPIDLGQPSSWVKAIPFAVEMARHFQARLHLMTVVPDYGFHYVSQYFPAGYEKGMIEEANRVLHEFVREHVPEEVSVEHIVAHGSIYREIVRVAEEVEADAIVMASHTPEVSDFIIGPNAERVLHKFRRSVFVIRD
jgi:nucleotide-binding universal stress UspA family protein